MHLLPLLATHLSFARSDGICVSRNTVKTQAISIYRKLGVTSRTAALRRAIELGLINAGIAEQRPAQPPEAAAVD